MQSPLLLTSLLERAGRLFPKAEIISQRPDDSTHRYSYGDFYRRARTLAAALQDRGLVKGDRVATLMWNNYRHLEAYFAVPAVGGVLHTLNLRLHPDELAYIVNHADDRFLIVDDVLLPVFAKIRDRVHPERVIVAPFSGTPVPADYEDYESLLQSASDDPVYVDLSETDAAGMCYTSGTTGKPKGVVYTHRSIALHSLSISLPDAFSIGRHDTVLAAMSMFHANAWGFPHAAVMNGSNLVLPGPNLHSERLLDLMSHHRVTLTGGVPTIWLGVIDALERQPNRWHLSKGARLVVAGSAAPESLFRRFDDVGVRVIQPWGMTETAPMATISTLKPHMEAWSDDEKYEVRAKQGLPSPFVEIRSRNDSGEVPWDGTTTGELEVRGPFVATEYHRMPEERVRWTADGWLRTGDVVTIDADGYIKIVDRIKDLIKSGGEWISSVDLENALVGHPAVAEAAVISIPHPKWQERPLAVVVLRPHRAASGDELRSFLASRFANWQLPDDFVFVPELPHASTGKILKSELRSRFKDWNRTVHATNASLPELAGQP